MTAPSLLQGAVGVEEMELHLLQLLDLVRAGNVKMLGTSVVDFCGVIEQRTLGLSRGPAENTHS